MDYAKLTFDQAREAIIAKRVAEIASDLAKVVAEYKRALATGVPDAGLEIKLGNVPEPKKRFIEALQAHSKAHHAIYVEDWQADGTIVFGECI